MSKPQLHPIARYLAEEGISQAAFGKKVGVTQGGVSQWISGTVPADRVLQVSEATGWRVTPHELHPAMYPDPDWLPPNRDNAA